MDDWKQRILDEVQRKKNSVETPEQKQTLRLWKAKMICSAIKSEEESGKRWCGKGRQDQMC